MQKNFFGFNEIIKTIIDLYRQNESEELFRFCEENLLNRMITERVVYWFCINEQSNIETLSDNERVEILVELKKTKYFSVKYIAFPVSIRIVEASLYSRENY